VLLNRFPVPTYKLGRRRVMDRDVLDAYFAKKKSEGIAKLENPPPTTSVKTSRSPTKDRNRGRSHRKD
jgi:hypothetical protein